MPKNRHCLLCVYDVEAGETVIFSCHISSSWSSDVFVVAMTILTIVRQSSNNALDRTRGAIFSSFGLQTGKIERQQGSRSHKQE